MIVVTGGTGTVGSRLVELLVRRGEQVRLFCRDAQRARAMFGERVETVEGDLDDLGSIATALNGADRLFLLGTAGATPETQGRQEGNAISAARRAGVRLVVKLSMQGAAERAPVRLAREHWAAERELTASGLGYTILRPSAYMQNFLRYTTEGVIYRCAGDGRVALVDAVDVAAVAAAALTEDGHDGRTYSLTGPRPLSYDEAAELLTAASGRRFSHVRVPRDPLVDAMTGAGVPRWLAADLAVQYEVIAAGDYDDVGADIAAITGRAARSFEAFAHEEFAPAFAARPGITSSMPNIFTDDLPGALAFYRDQLGFALDYQVPREGEPEHVVLRCGESVLALSTPAGVGAVGLRPTPGNPFELVVWCADVDRETARLRSTGAAVVVEPYDHHGGHRRAYLTDPAGSWLALVDAH